MNLVILAVANVSLNTKKRNIKYIPPTNYIINNNSKFCFFFLFLYCCLRIIMDKSNTHENKKNRYEKREKIDEE